VQPLNYTLPFQGWKIGERIIDHIQDGPISASPNEDIDVLILSIQEKWHGPLNLYLEMNILTKYRIPNIKESSN
jgi:hypothetical protein